MLTLTDIRAKLENYLRENLVTADCIIHDGKISVIVVGHWLYGHWRARRLISEFFRWFLNEDVSLDSFRWDESDDTYSARYAVTVLN